MDVRCLMLKQFKRLYNFYFRISAIIFGKQSNETWTEKDDACGSGKRTYSRKTTIFIRARSTKMEGTITLKQYRVSPLGDDWKTLSDCATCPPCPDQVDKHPCGSVISPKSGTILKKSFVVDGKVGCEGVTHRE